MRINYVQRLLRISGLRITFAICFRAFSPDFCTFECESVRTSISFGTILGRHAESCFGAQNAIDPKSSAEAHFVRHESSFNAVRSDGNT